MGPGACTWVVAELLPLNEQGVSFAIQKEG